MTESYSDDAAPGAPTHVALARDLLARLVPGADATLLVRGLLAEHASRRESPPLPAGSEGALAAREVQRVRRQLARGEAAQAAQHAVSNPLTALLAEAQLLELEPLGGEHRAAVRRMIELARRVVTAVRRLDAAGADTIG